MHAKVGASPAYVLSQLSTAVVGAACFVASVFVGASVLNSAKTALFKPSLVISSQEIAWTGANYRFVSEKQFPPSVQTPDLQALVPSNVEAGLARIARLEKRAKWERRILLARAGRHHDAHAFRGRARARSVAVQSDALRFVDAAPKVAPAASVAMTEAQRLQYVHSILVNHFFVALREMSTPDLNTLVARAMNTQPAPVRPQPPQKAVAWVASKVRHQRGRPNVRPVVVSVAARKTAPVAIARKEADRSDTIMNTQAAAQTVLVNHHAVNETQFNKWVDQVFGYQDFAIPPGSAGSHPIQVTETATQTQPQTVLLKTTRKSRLETQAQTAAPPATIAQQRGASNSQTVNIHGHQWVFPKVPTAAYPKTDDPATQPAAVLVTDDYPPIDQRPILPVTTHHALVPHAAPQVTAAAPGANLSPASTAENSLPSTSTPIVLATRASFPAISAAVAAAPRISFVEAFDSTQSVSDAQSEILTREDPASPYGQSHQGWRIARAADHWPTVFWNQSGEIPLLSNNTAKVLSLKTGASIQRGAGIVIAKVPAGWTLELSGRAERPIIYAEGALNASGDSGQFLNGDNPNEERFYIFLNASPGEQILYLVRSGETGAAAIPVFGGMLSYADLSHEQSRSVMGKVLDASGEDAQGMSAMQVQVVGSGQSSVTNPNGYFRIDDVVTFGSLPLFLEVSSNRGYPHRYKINPLKHRFSLFYMSEEQVHDWVGQLDGGVSSDSGLVVGALPNLAAANEDKKPVPEVKTLAEDPTLTPETYTLSPSGQLLIKTPLSSNNSRLLGVQVPEGPTLVQAKDSENRVIWSELIVVSPRVLSVVGPY